MEMNPVTVHVCFLKLEMFNKPLLDTLAHSIHKMDTMIIGMNIKNMILPQDGPSCPF